MSRTSGSNRLSRALLSALSLFLVTMNLIAIPAALAQEVTPPTIVSDKLDYATGEWVTLTGSGWSGDLTVDIYANDSLGRTWERNVDVLVDQNGNITDSFNLPDWFVASYDILATGNETDRTATVSFTDAPAGIDQLHHGRTKISTGSSATWVSPTPYIAKERPSRTARNQQPGGRPYLQPDFEWDTSQGDKHAIDYLTSFDRS